MEAKRFEQSQPGFIRKFSKQQSPEERQKLAGEIWQKRKEGFSQKRELSKREKDLQTKLEDIKRLEEEISSLSRGGLSKIKNLLKLQSLQSLIVPKVEL